MSFLQTEISECGLVCLAYSSSKLGAHLEMTDLRRKFPVSSRGLTLKQLMQIASSLNMLARAVRCELNEISQLKLPAILHWRLNHFVVLEKVTAKHVIVHDPAHGRRKISLGEAGKYFTGFALELSAAPEFKKRREKSPLSISQWIRMTPAVYSGLGQVLVLSLLLQGYVVASPFYMQLAVDQAAMKGDTRLLVTLAVGFGLFGLFNVIAGLLRGIAMQRIAAFMSWDMSLRLFRHLVRLPLGWFQKRRLADTISRFDSINPIRDLVSGSLISTAIDGLLAVTTILMMFLFSAPLALWSLVGVAFSTSIRFATLSNSLRLSAESLGAQIAENSKRIETIRAIQTIKIMSAEAEQEAQWSNKYSDVIKRNLSKGTFDLFVRSANQCTDVVISTLVIYIGVREVIDHKITIGILYAFTSYRWQFTSALGNVIDQAIQWKLTDIYSFRLADVVLTPTEDGIDRIENALPDFSGKIEVKNLAFRYSSYESLIFRSLNLTIEAGEFVAIVGPSGIGKTSLLKLLCGLYPATMGDILIDGRPIAAWGPKALRRAYGVVMQDDMLVSGTVAENVAFFDDQIDMDRVWLALEAAALKEDVLAMPMKAESLIGDMGGILSGGQKQRLLIARALYKKPKFLLLDEATSHLDAKNESTINESLKRLNITRIVIAHRVETIRAADKVFDMASGTFVKFGSDITENLASLQKGVLNDREFGE